MCQYFPKLRELGRSGWLGQRTFQDDRRNLSQIWCRQKLLLLDHSQKGMWSWRLNWQIYQPILFLVLDFQWFLFLSPRLFLNFQHNSLCSKRRDKGNKYLINLIPKSYKVGEFRPQLSLTHRIKLYCQTCWPWLLNNPQWPCHGRRKSKLKELVRVGWPLQSF